MVNPFHLSISKPFSDRWFLSDTWCCGEGFWGSKGIGRQKKLFWVFCVQSCCEKQELERVRVIVPVPLCTRQAFTCEEYDAEAEPHLLMFPFEW